MENTEQFQLPPDHCLGIVVQTDGWTVETSRVKPERPIMELNLFFFNFQICLIVKWRHKPEKDCGMNYWHGWWRAMSGTYTVWLKHTDLGLGATCSLTGPKITKDKRLLLCPLTKGVFSTNHISVMFDRNRIWFPVSGLKCCVVRLRYRWLLRDAAPPPAVSSPLWSLHRGWVPHRALTHGPHVDVCPAGCCQCSHLLNWS